MKATFRDLAGIAFAVLALLVAPAAHPHVLVPSPDAVPYRVEEFTVGIPAHLNVRTFGGAVRVEGRPGNTVRVEAYVQRNGTYYRRGDIDFSGYRIEITHEGSSVSAIARREHGGRLDDLTVSFVVYAPAHTDCDLHTQGGPIALSDLEGTQKAETSGGGIEIDQARGTMTLRTSGGPIDVSEVRGRIDARTRGGPIAVAGGSGSFDLETAGGPIRLQRVSGHVRAHTSGGSIRADITKLAGGLNLSTDGGDITAMLPGDQGFDLDAHGSSVDLDRGGFSGSLGRDRAEGKVNGGGPKVRLHTSGGVITIR